MKTIILILVIVLSPVISFAQMGEHHHHEMDMSDTSMHMSMEDMPEMNSMPMYQIASGTSWVPGSSPMYGLHYSFEHSSLMIHGALFLEYDHQSGPRGDDVFAAPNWVMAMYDYRLGDNDILGARAMLSADAPILGNKGYPLLLQTGEGLTDRQHPHDLFDELALSYEHTFSSDWSSELYLGIPGEPSIGPPAFMHRTSAFSNPNAPLSHHWQDATHITFGVATLGIRYKNIKLEGSLFNGREPDSDRYNIDRPQFNSYSARLSYNPTTELALQTSYGLLKNVEGDGADVQRLTASAIYTKMLADRSWWSSSIVFGQNKLDNEPISNSILLESQYSIDNNMIYGRIEFVQKYLHDLQLATEGLADVSAITLGYARELATVSSLTLSAGIQGTYNIVPPDIKKVYGDSPIGAQLYISITPKQM